MMSDEQNTSLEGLDVAQLVAIIRQERGENAKLRQRAQEAEASRDKLSGVVQAGQVEAWHRLAKDRKVRAEALDDLDGRVELSELLGEDGQLDEGKATTALDGLKQSHSYYFEQPAAVPASSGGGTHTGGATSTAGPTWADFLAQDQPTK